MNGALDGWRNTPSKQPKKNLLLRNPADNERKRRRQLSRQNPIVFVGLRNVVRKGGRKIAAMGWRRLSGRIRVRLQRGDLRRPYAAMCCIAATYRGESATRPLLARRPAVLLLGSAGYALAEVSAPKTRSDRLSDRRTAPLVRRTTPSLSALADLEDSLIDHRGIGTLGVQGHDPTY